MRINFTDPNEQRTAKVWNLDTGERITPCCWADDETGEYEFIPRENGMYLIDPVTKCVVRRKGKARLRIEVLPGTCDRRRPGDPFEPGSTHPIWRELSEIALKDPTVHYFLKAHRVGSMEEREALLGMLVALWKQKEALQEQLKEMHYNQYPMYVIRHPSEKADIPEDELAAAEKAIRESLNQPLVPLSSGPVYGKGQVREMMDAGFWPGTICGKAGASAPTKEQMEEARKVQVAIMRRFVFGANPGILKAGEQANRLEVLSTHTDDKGNVVASFKLTPEQEAAVKSAVKDKKREVELELSPEQIKAIGKVDEEMLGDQDCDEPTIIKK